MAELTANCKGTIKDENGKDQPCPEHVRYGGGEIISAVFSPDSAARETFLPENSATFDIYLICKRGHSCKYWVKSGGLS